MKFLHLRYHEPSDDKEVDISPRGGVTVAYEFDEATKMVTYAMAQCRHTDNFCRKIGRDIAQGRYLDGRIVAITVDNFKQIPGRLADEVYEHYMNQGALDVSAYLY